jgi:glycosyltransferase involved in cell wall biosynthesis
MFDVSIIIPVYKAKYTIKKTLESINNQKFNNYTPKIELVLSIDDNKNYEKYRSLLNNEIINTKIVSTNRIGSGPGNTRNIGFKKSIGRYVCFLDADDEYSENYVCEMLQEIEREKLLIAVTKIFNEDKIITEYTSKKKYMDIKELIKYPCSFHPFMQRSKFKEYKHFPSQDIYNLTEYLSEKKIKIIKKAYYRLNLRKNSLTMKEGFEHKIKQAYKKYLIKGIKERNNKISRHFAERLILNKNFEEWKKLSNSKKSYYEYLGDVYGE